MKPPRFPPHSATHAAALRVPLLTLLLGAAVLPTAIPRAHGQMSGARAVTLSAAERRRVNVFLSNFSEAGLPSFARGRLADDAMTRFAIRHECLNRFDRAKSDGRGNLLVPTARVDATCRKYFGRAPGRHRALPGCPLRGGAYATAWGDGVGITFTRVTRLTARPNGEITAEAEIFGAGNAWEGDPYGDPSRWPPFDRDLSPERTGTVRATLRKASDARYILLEYNTR